MLKFIREFFFFIQHKSFRVDYLEGITIKSEVDTSKLRYEILTAIPVVVEAFRKFDLKPRLTSTYEEVFDRLYNSYHYQHLAFDIGLWTWKGAKRYNIQKGKLTAIFKEIKGKLGEDYDVVLKKNHIHIEYDERRADRE